MAKKNKEPLKKTNRIIWMTVGLLGIFVLILTIRILINVQDYFP